MSIKPSCTKSREVDPKEVDLEHEGTQSALIHERVILCCRMARLLRHALSGITWPCVRFADRSRLDRALAQLESDIRLARTVVTASQNEAGGAKDQLGGTTKAASSREV